MAANERTEQARMAVQRRVVGAFPSADDIIARLSASERLTVYLGIDPTGVDIHLGHTIPLLLLKDIAALGHDVVLLIGDFTARIGDPTEKLSARKALTTDEIATNMSGYEQQIQRILPAGTYRIAHNSEWLSALTMEQVLRLTSLVTVQQMMQRDMFQVRQKEEKPIYLSEFLYPLMQGYDSVALRADGEVGGNDQTFNMLVGRDFSREILGKDKFVLAIKLLADSATGKKMSKSEGVLIALGESAQEIRRKILATDDGMVRTMFELCTEVPYTTIDEWQKEGEPVPQKPREAKEALATELIRMYHGATSVDDAASAVSITATGPLDRVLVETGAAASLSEAKRLVEQGGVQINGVRATRWDVQVDHGDELKVGKGKHFRVS